MQLRHYAIQGFSDLIKRSLLAASVMGPAAMSMILQTWLDPGLASLPVRYFKCAGQEVDSYSEMSFYFLDSPQSRG